MKRIINQESQKEQFRHQRNVFIKTKSLKGVTSIEEFVDGEWIERSSPVDIERVLKESNIGKYSSTNDTPLMKEPWSSILGFCAETKEAREIVKGKFTFPPDTNHYLKKMLMETKRDSDTNRHNGEVSIQEYKSVWKNTKEKRTSSKSNRHNGVYKAVALHSERDTKNS